MKLLGHRWRQTPSGRREQVQVQWSSDAAEELTWEDRITLQEKFPAAVAWGQATTQGGGDVSNPADMKSTNEELGLATRQTRPKRLVQPNRRHIGPEWTQ